MGDTYSSMEAFVLEERVERFLDQHMGHVGPLQEALNVVPGKMVKAGMAIPRVFERFPELVGPLTAGMEVRTNVLLIDLSPFSRVVAPWKPDRIRLFLDRYYRIVVDAIIQADGVVEKYIGDAVLAVFGPPFTKAPLDDVLKGAVDLSAYLTERIHDLFEGEVAAKTAIAQGRCFLGYVGPAEHQELTVIGNPLTEVFRLESEADANSIVVSSRLFERIKHNYVIRSPHYWAIRGVSVDWEYAEKDLHLKGIGDLRASILQRI